MTEVVKMSIWAVLAYFVAYIISHGIIIYLYKSWQEELNKNPNNEEIKKKVNVLKHLSRWFPAIYVLFLIISFMS